MKPPIFRPQRCSSRSARAVVAAFAVLATAGVAARLAASSSAATDPQLNAAAPAAAAKSVLLFTWDTTRADRLGAYGHARAATPGFDALAREGLLYERAYAAAPVTLPSHTTILSGVLPPAHGVRDNGIFQVGEEARLLSEVLKEQGFATAAFVASFILDAKFGLAQGFDRYEAPDPSRLGLGWNVIERTAPQVTEGALRFIDTLAPGQRFFLWIHYYDPHAPHESAAGERTGEQDDYDAEIARCDREARRVMERLRERGLADGLLTVITSDHGESHGDHGEQTHGTFVYDSTMRVPLVVAPAPDGVAPGTRVTSAVSTADVAATLLERLGVGREALPDARTPPLPVVVVGEGDRAVYLEAFTPFYTHRWHPLSAVVWNGFKYIEAPRRELYAVGSDETDNLLDREPDVAARLATRLAALKQELAPLGWVARGELGSEDAAKLEALGYVASAIDGDPTDPGLPDPKERIGDLVRLDRIETLRFEASQLLQLDVALRTGRPPTLEPEQKAKGEAKLVEALAEVAAIRAAHAGDPYLDPIEAGIAISLGRYEEAVEPLERALLRAPRTMPLRYNLAVAYGNSGRIDMALREMEKTLFVEPRSLQAHRWLVQMTASHKRWPAAAWWLDRLAELPGQRPADLDGVRRARAQVEEKLKATGEKPLAPRPVTEEELVPERIRAAAAKPAG